MSTKSIVISADQAGDTLAAGLRGQMPGHTWTQIRRLIETRRVTIAGVLCLDPARRLKEGETVEVLDRPAQSPRQPEAIVVRCLDKHIVVVEKPTGMSTVRHPSERDWPAQRKALSPTLEDQLPPLLAGREGRKRKGPLPRLRVVHRIDKETSGLVVFARTIVAERALGRQFRRHTVIRRYLAVVPGYPSKQTITTRLVRDRGDGRRGSTSLPGIGKEAVTHVEVVEKLKGYTLLSCRLETGRTHQIRIHLAELGHPVCGEKVYNRSQDGTVIKDKSGAPRLSLHAAELGFVHPVTGQALHWTMPLPAGLEKLVERLRSPSAHR